MSYQLNESDVSSFSSLDSLINNDNKQIPTENTKKQTQREEKQTRDHSVICGQELINSDHGHNRLERIVQKSERRISCLEQIVMEQNEAIKRFQEQQQLYEKMQHGFGDIHPPHPSRTSTPASDASTSPSFVVLGRSSIKTESMDVLSNDIPKEPPQLREFLNDAQVPTASKPIPPVQPESKQHSSNFTKSTECTSSELFRDISRQDAGKQASREGNVIESVSSIPPFPITPVSSTAVGIYASYPSKIRDSTPGLKSGSSDLLNATRVSAEMAPSSNSTAGRSGVHLGEQWKPLNTMSRSRSEESSKHDVNLISLTSDYDKVTSRDLVGMNEATGTASERKDGAKELFSLLQIPQDDKNPAENQMPQIGATDILQRNPSHSGTGICENILHCANQVASLEARYMESQATLQRQQAQLEAYGDMTPEEVQRLRSQVQSLKEESENLLAFIKDQQENKGSLKDQKQRQPMNAADINWMQSPNHPMMARLQSLETMNAKLFLANKGWHTKWEVLRQQLQEEREDLESRLKAAEEDNAHMKTETASLKSNLQDEKLNADSYKQLAKRYEQTMEERGRTAASLKYELEKLTEERRQLELQLARAKVSEEMSGKNQDESARQQVKLMQHQLNIFADDFHSEQKERKVAESKADRYRKERDSIKMSHETNQRKLQMQGTELQSKSNYIEQLRHQIQALKVELQKKKAPEFHANYSSLRHASHNSHQAASTQPFSYQSNEAGPATAPEHLPGAWTCNDCTYINYPGRTVCEICGLQKGQGNDMAALECFSAGELHSRGLELPFNIMHTDVSDVVEVDKTKNEERK